METVVTVYEIRKLVQQFPVQDPLYSNKKKNCWP